MGGGGKQGVPNWQDGGVTKSSQNFYVSSTNVWLWHLKLWCKNDRWFLRYGQITLEGGGAVGENSAEWGDNQIF